MEVAVGLVHLCFCVFVYYFPKHVAIEITKNLIVLRDERRKACQDCSVDDHISPRTTIPHRNHLADNRPRLQCLQRRSPTSTKFSPPPSSPKFTNFSTLGPKAQPSTSATSATISILASTITTMTGKQPALSPPSDPSSQLVLITSPPTFYSSCHRPNPQTSPSFSPASSCSSTKHLRTSLKARRGCRPSGTSNRSPYVFVGSASPSPPACARGVWSAGLRMGGALSMRWHGSSSFTRHSCTPSILIIRRCSTALSRTIAWRLRRSLGSSILAA